MVFINNNKMNHEDDFGTFYKIKLLYLKLRFNVEKQ